MKKEEKEAYKAWLNSSSGKPFWDELVEMLSTARLAACKVSPDKKQSIEEFNHQRTVFAARAETILSIMDSAQDIADLDLDIEI